MTGRVAFSSFLCPVSCNERSCFHFKKFFLDTSCTEIHPASPPVRMSCKPRYVQEARVFVRVDFRKKKPKGLEPFEGPYPPFPVPEVGTAGGLPAVMVIMEPGGPGTDARHSDLTLNNNKWGSLELCWQVPSKKSVIKFFFLSVRLRLCFGCLSPCSHS